MSEAPSRLQYQSGSGQWRQVPVSALEREVSAGELTASTPVRTSLSDEPLAACEHRLTQVFFPEEAEAAKARRAAGTQPVLEEGSDGGESEISPSVAATTGTASGAETAEADVAASTQADKGEVDPPQDAQASPAQFAPLTPPKLKPPVPPRLEPKAVTATAPDAKSTTNKTSAPVPPKLDRKAAPAKTGSGSGSRAGAAPETPRPAPGGATNATKVFWGSVGGLLILSIIAFSLGGGDSDSPLSQEPDAASATAETTREPASAASRPTRTTRPTQPTQPIQTARDQRRPAEPAGRPRSNVTETRPSGGRMAGADEGTQASAGESRPAVEPEREVQTSPPPPPPPPVPPPLPRETVYALRDSPLFSRPRLDSQVVTRIERGRSVWRVLADSVPDGWIVILGQSTYFYAPDTAFGENAPPELAGGAQGQMQLAGAVPVFTPTGTQAVDTIPAGARFTVVGLRADDPDRVEVILDDGRVGYIAAHLLETGADGEKPAAGVPDAQVGGLIRSPEFQTALTQRDFQRTRPRGRIRANGVVNVTLQCRAVAGPRYAEAASCRVTQNSAPRQDQDLFAEWAIELAERARLSLQQADGPINGRQIEIHFSFQLD